MATKKQEQETLEVTLEKQEHDSAKKTKELSNSKITRDDIEAHLVGPTESPLRHPTPSTTSAASESCAFVVVCRPS